MCVCLILWVKSYAIKEHYYCIFLNIFTILKIGQAGCELIVSFWTDCNLWISKSLYGHGDIISKTDPVVISDNAPFIGFIDEV